MTVTEEWFPQTNPKFLDPTHREKLLVKYLKPYLEQNYILCLQEVSSKDFKYLKKFLEQFNYFHVYNPLSSIKSTRLGLLIGFPSQYKLIKSYELNIGAEILQSVGNFNKNSEVELASSDKRKVSIIKLEFNSKTFFVATYHMPCKFLQQTLMEAQAIFCMKIINDIAGNNNVIFTGDFNSKYNEGVYNIITSNDFTSDFADYVKLNFHCCKNIFKDSLSHINNRLPTCYDQKDGNDYILDYIFYRGPNIKLISSELVNHSFPIPNESYQSDHLPIIATFSLS